MKRIVKLILLLPLIFAMVIGNTPAVTAKGEEYPSINKAAKETYIQKTKFDNIYQTEKGDYAVFYDDGSYEPVERFDINLSDFTNVLQVIEEAKMPQEEAEYLMKLSIEVINEEREAGETVYFAPSPLVSTYTTYNGLSVRNDLLYTYNNEFGWRFVAQGTIAKSIANAAVQIGIAIGSIASSAIGFGASLLSIFEAIVGSNVTVVSSNDFVQVDMNYHDIKQWSYGQLDGVNWYLGYCSERVTINKIMEHQHFMVNGYGRTEDSTQYVYATRESSHFTSPAVIVYYNMSLPVDEWITATLYGITWLF